MSSHIHALTHGGNGLLLAYVFILIPMLVGLRHGRAPLASFFRALLLAVPAVVVAGFLISVESSILGLNNEDILELLLGVVTMIGVGYGAGRWFAARKGPAGTEHRRGAVITPEQVGAGKRRGSAIPNNAVTLAGVALDLQDEVKHFKLIGATGTGKSTAIRELLSGALGRGDRAVIADPDGGYLDTFYDAGRGDVILNPFSAAGAKWDLFGEISNEYDVEQLARSLIPNNSDPDVSWVEYSRTFFGAVIQQCIAGNIRGDIELDRLLTRAPMDELKMLLAGTSAGAFFTDGSEKMLGCIYAITASAVRALKYTARQQATPFSVKQWVRQGAARSAGGQGGVLFLPYKAGEIAALRSMISAWMRLAIFEAMSKPEGDQRLWFIIDELDALGEIDGLKDALARVRKFGGRCGLGLQSIAQVSGTYSKGAAETIVENCGNTVIFRCSGSEHGGTSEFASKLIGQREVAHLAQAKTRRRGDWLTYSTTTSEQVKIEPAVMASEIERLADFEGFLKVASVPDWQRVRLAAPSGSSSARGKAPAAYALPAITIAPVPVTPVNGSAAMSVSPGTTGPGGHTRLTRKRVRKSGATGTKANTGASAANGGGSLPSS
jgi:hypothetical protein